MISRSMLAKGSVLLLTCPGAGNGGGSEVWKVAPRIRLLESCKNVPPSWAIVKKALALVEKGEDQQKVAQVLGFSDPSQVNAFLRVVVENRGKEHEVASLPQALLESSGSSLSSEAMKLAKMRPSDFVDVPFIVEGCGARENMNVKKKVSLDPVLPLEWMGKQFRDGKAFQKLLEALNAGKEDQSKPRGKAIKKFKSPWITFENIIRADNVWDDSDAIERALTARNLEPSVLALVHFPSLRVEISPFTKHRWESLKKENNEHNYRILVGQEGRLSNDAKQDHTVVLSVSKKLIDSGERVPSRLDTVPQEQHAPESDAFIPEPTALMREVDLPLSLLEKALKRGTSFSSRRQLDFAINKLIETSHSGHQGSSPTQQILWKVFMCAFADVCPYLTSGRSSKIFSLSDLFGLSLVAHADPSFRLPKDLQERFRLTVLSLQNFEDTSAVLWPWRGFSKVGEKTMVLEERVLRDTIAELRNVVRAAIAFPIHCSASEREMMQRYLTCLADENWAKKVSKLPLAKPFTKAERKAFNTEPLSAAESETLRASMDAAYSPNVLLLLQASLPFPPKNTTQHSIRSLGIFEGRVSSNLNSRSIRKQIAGETSDAELFRIQQFLGVKTDQQPSASSSSSSSSSNSQEAAKQKGKPEVELHETVEKTVNLTPHERLLNRILHSVQDAMLRKTIASTPSWQNSVHGKVDSLAKGEIQVVKAQTSKQLKARPPSGKKPSAHEARTAFLQLFGSKYILTDKNDEEHGDFTAIIAGDKENPLLVRTLQTSESSADKRTSSNKFLPADSAEVQVARERLLRIGERNIRVNFAPPPGFRWKWDERDKELRTEIVEKVIEKRRRKSSSLLPTRSRLAFLVDGEEISAFDASPLLIPCNEPFGKPLKCPFQNELKQAFYVGEAGSLKKDEDALDLFRILHSYAKASSGLGPDQVYDWEAVRKGTTLDSHVFRDLLLKFRMLEHDSFTLSASATTNNQNWQMDFTNEGACLRVMFGLCALYPSCVELATGQHSFYRFKVKDVASMQFMDILACLQELAFPSNDWDISLEPSRISITTKLWEHQQETVNKVLSGIRNGMMGFADASTVGAGKTLSALAAISGAQDFLVERKEPLRGSLILLPTNALTTEWAQQIFFHTRGVHVLQQDKSGFLKSKGVSNAGAPARKIPRDQKARIDSDCIVLTTLGRAREHPFNCTGWDMVVIDECISVQSETALQSAAAWRQCLASRCGVMMLSATMYRSKLSALFYLIRMLRSSLPRTEPYLSTLLSEHAIVALPENPRKWSMKFKPVPLGEEIEQRYRSTVEESFHGGQDVRNLFVELKNFLRENYEKTSAIKAIVDEVQFMRDKKLTPLVFAVSEKEKAFLLEQIPNSESLQSTSDLSKLKKGSQRPVLVVTVREGSHGLNLQDRADAIITRPQPGDLIEQMKGRIDRPGQVKKNLALTVVVAHNTIEEAEAANVRLCGAFFRAYLDPLSCTFQERALVSSIEAKVEKNDTSVKHHFSSRYQGAIAQAFRSKLDAQLDDVETHSPGKQRERKLSSHSSKMSPKSKRNNDDDDDEEEIEIALAIDAKEVEELTNDSAKRRKTISKSEGPIAKRRKPATKAKRVKKLPEENFIGNGAPRKICDKLVAEALQHFAKHDKRMANVVNQVGAPTSLLEKIGTTDPFSALARSIIYQQISTKAGASIFGRFVNDVCKGNVTPDVVLAASDEALRGAGLSARKAQYMRHLAQHFNENDLKRETLEQMTDAEIFKSLIQVKGIGPWSVQMFLMFSLGRPDVLPYGDLVVQKAFKRLYALSNGEDDEDTKVTCMPRPNELFELSESWRPYRSIGTWLLWHAVESDSCTYTF